MNYAYVTLLSSIDYLPAILILNNNLKTIGSQYPLYVMITEDIYNDVKMYIEKESIHYIIVPVLHYSQATIDFTKDKRMLSIASKMNIFTLTQFDKVIYLDADCFILKSIDELFNYPDGAMYDDFGRSVGFVGLFVCCPKMHAFTYYMQILQNSKEPMWESDLLEPLWFPYKTNMDYHIPPQYYVNITCTDLDTLKVNYKEFYGIHFCYIYKPWNYDSAEEYLQDYYKEFTKQSLFRQNIVKFYITHYVKPFKEKYPEIFNRG